jgi:uncharacterized protein (TIGR02231 family)
MTYRANVLNNTGFDWNGVQLLLSTAQPLEHNNLPDWKPVYLDFVYPNIANMPTRSVNTIVSSTAGTTSIDGGDANIKGSRENATNYYLDGIRISGDAPKVQDINGPAIENQVVSTDNRLTAPEELLVEFGFSKPQTIQTGGQDNMVTVSEQDIPVTYIFQTIPKLNPAVFLLARLTNYGQYNLLPGTANLFQQDTYVGQAVIHPTTTNDTLLLSLGRDEQIAVARIQPQDLTGRKKTFDKYVKETFVYEISLKNNKPEPVMVEVVDQVPVSRREEIKIELDERTGADYNPENGKLKWNLALKGNESRKIRFGYNVKYPKDKIFTSH